jgi:hypothetical protein
MNCSSCNAVVDPRNVLYSPEANVLCAECFAKLDLIETDKRAAKNIVRAASAALFAGVMTWPVIMIGTIAMVFAIIIAFTSAIFALRSMFPGNERFTKHLTGGQRAWVYIGSIGGIVLAGIPALLIALGVGVIVALG